MTSPTARQVHPGETIIAELCQHVRSERITALVIRRGSGEIGVRLTVPDVVLEETHLDGLHRLLRETSTTAFHEELDGRRAGRRDE